MTALDFLVIGAQKSATTALHHYLKDHPKIALPAAKEAPFFDGDDPSMDSWLAFSARHFRPQKEQLLGKMSPQYMGHPDAACRIRRLMPDTRLIAILRDPIERAWSHFQMNKRRELEYGCFDAAIERCLDPVILASARRQVPPKHALGFESEADFYVAWGEYGRILRAYLTHFRREQILLLTTSQLRGDPGATLDRIMEFLDLGPGYRPADLGAVVHRGGVEAVISRRWKNRIKSVPAVQCLWNGLPESTRETWRFWFEQKNIKTASSREDMVLSDDNRRRLRRHFASDMVSLQQDFGILLPWAGQYDTSPRTVANCNG